MFDNDPLHRRRFPAAQLTAPLAAAVIVCAIFGIPFAPAILWSFALAILFTPLRTRIIKVIGVLIPSRRFDTPTDSGVAARPNAPLEMFRAITCPT